MLQSIRSPYILKIIIAHIKEDIKLKALRYNKKLQNNLGLTLTDFKRLSGKYIIKIGDDKIEEHDGQILGSSSIILYIVASPNDVHIAYPVSSNTCSSAKGILYCSEEYFSETSSYSLPSLSFQAPRTFSDTGLESSFSPT